MNLDGGAILPEDLSKQFLIKSLESQNSRLFFLGVLSLGPHIKIFPSELWQAFLSTPMVEKLAKPLGDLSQLTTWPSAEEWQARGTTSLGYPQLGLKFAFERKPGQRARRKLVKGTLRSYESWIFESHEIPTRADNWHDFFNAMIWINFPRSKFALHRKALAIQKSWPASIEYQIGRRSRLQDRLTCFDEGGVVFEMEEGESKAELETLLHGHDEARKEEFVRRHASRFTLFGHGILEVLIKQRIQKEEGRVNASCIILEHSPMTLDQKLENYLESFDEKSQGHGTITVAWL